MYLMTRVQKLPLVALVPVKDRLRSFLGNRRVLTSMLVVW